MNQIEAYRAAPPASSSYIRTGILSVALLATGAAIALISSNVGRDYTPTAQPAVTPPVSHELNRRIDRLQDQIASQQTITELRVALAREQAQPDNNSELAALRQQIAALQDRKPSYQLDVVRIDGDPRPIVMPPRVPEHLQHYIAAVLGEQQ